MSRASIVMLTKKTRNLSAFLSSCEDNLRMDYGVYDFLTNGRVLENPEMAYERLSTARASAREASLIDDVSFINNYFEHELIRSK